MAFLPYSLSASHCATTLAKALLREAESIGFPAVQPLSRATIIVDARERSSQSAANALATSVLGREVSDIANSHHIFKRWVAAALPPWVPGRSFPAALR